MKFKKLLSLCLVTAMAASLAACGSSKTNETSKTDDTTPSEAPTEEPKSDDNASSDETTPEAQESNEDLLAEVIPKETVTLDVFDQLANYSGEQIGWFAKVILDKFNVKLNIINDPNAGVLQTRMENGNLGDLVIWGDDKDDYQQAVQKKMLYDWDEDDLLSEYGPYIKENMQKALQKNRDLNGGVLHGFGYDVARNAEERQDFFYTWDLRWDLYKQLGYPEVKNLDDLVDVLAKMKEICPTDDNGKPTYGVSLFNDWDGDMVMFVKSLVTAYNGYDEFGFGFYDPTEQKYHPCLEKDGPYVKALKFYNTLYQKGLLDPDSQTQKYNGMTEDFQNGTAFFNQFNWMGSGLYNTDAHTGAGKAMYPMVPSEATPLVYGQNVYGGNRIFSIGAKTEYPELCMAIINWLATPEGAMTSEYGPKDVCWKYDENGNTAFTELGRACKLDVLTEMKDGYTGTFQDGVNNMNLRTWALDSVNPESNGDTYNYMKWKTYKEAAKSDIESDWRTWSKCDLADEYLGTTNFRLAPGTTYTGKQKSEELTVEWNQVADCIKTNSWKAIYAKDDAEFDAIVADMSTKAEEYGYADCIKFMEDEAARRAQCENDVK